MDSTLERATDIDSNLMWYSKQVLSSKAERTTKSQVMVMDTDNGYSTVHEQPGNAGAHDHYGKLQSVEVSKQVDTALQGLDADVRASYMRLVDCLNEVEPAEVEQTRANANDQTEQTRVEVVSSVDQPLGDAIFVDGFDDYGTGELLTQLTARQPQATYRTWPQQNLGDQNMQVDDCAPYSIANGQTMTMPEGSSLPGLEDNSLSKLAACLDSDEIDDLVNKLFENCEPTCSQAASQNVPIGQIKAPKQHHTVVLLAPQLLNDSAILSGTHEADWPRSTSTSETVSPSLHVADTNIYEPVIADVQSDVALIPPVLPLSLFLVQSNCRVEFGGGYQLEHDDATPPFVWPAASSYAPFSTTTSSASTSMMQDEALLQNFNRPRQARRRRTSNSGKVTKNPRFDVKRQTTDYTFKLRVTAEKNCKEHVLNGKVVYKVTCPGKKDGKPCDVILTDQPIQDKGDKRFNKRKGSDKEGQIFRSNFAEFIRHEKRFHRELQCKHCELKLYGSEKYDEHQKTHCQNLLELELDLLPVQQFDQLLIGSV